MSKKDETYYKWKKEYYRKRRDKKSFSNQKWQSKEIDLLFEFNGTDTELSEILKRSVQAIQVKRSKIIKLESVDEKKGYYSSGEVYSYAYDAEPVPTEVPTEVPTIEEVGEDTEIPTPVRFGTFDAQITMQIRPTRANEATEQGF